MSIVKRGQNSRQVTRVVRSDVVRFCSGDEPVIEGRGAEETPDLSDMGTTNGFVRHSAVNLNRRRIRSSTNRPACR